MPEFSKFTIENCVSSIAANSNIIKKSIADIEKRLEGKEISPENIKEILVELDHNSNQLETVWGIAKTLYLANNGSIPTKSYLNIHEKAREVKASKFTNKIIYEALQSIRNSDQFKSLDYEEQKLVEKFLLEGRLNGLGLTEKMKDQLSNCIVNLGKERSQFLNKVNYAINTFNHTINDYNVVRDFPEHLLEATAKSPKDSTNGPWKITLHPHIYEEFLKYCPDRMQRWNVWQANVRKCSLHSEKSAENSTHVEKIRGFRQKQAEILGFSSYAEMSMQTKMVQSVDNIKQLFTDLLKYAGPKQVTEVNNLQAFASKSGFQHDLDLFDIAFWQRKYLLSEHDFDEQKFKEYFPLPTVLNGLFKLSETVFDIKIVEKDADVWHENVKYFEVFDNSGNGFEPIGGFYLDCYNKEAKFTGNNSGHMVGIRNLNPLSALIFNFNSPLYGKPYLLSINDLKMVFKTFGTQLQHLLTKSRFSGLAGLSNIEWDASQLCGQVLINFLDDPKVLKQISSHYVSGETLDEKYFNSILIQKQSMAGYNMCNELYLANLDIELFNSKDFWLDVVKRLWPIYQVLPLDKKNAHVCSMTNIIAGDWSAAYFSHLYSKMLAADVCEAFSDPSNDITSIGKRFKETFLRSGGSISTPEVFRRFRGRDPSHEALLKRLDLLKSSTVAEY